MKPSGSSTRSRTPPPPCIAMRHEGRADFDRGSQYTDHHAGLRHKPIGCTDLHALWRASIPRSAIAQRPLAPSFSFCRIVVAGFPGFRVAEKTRSALGRHGGLIRRARPPRRSPLMVAPCLEVAAEACDCVSSAAAFCRWTIIAQGSGAGLAPTSPFCRARDQDIRRRVSAITTRRKPEACSPAPISRRTFMRGLGDQRLRL